MCIYFIVLYWTFLGRASAGTTLARVVLYGRRDKNCNGGPSATAVYVTRIRDDENLLDLYTYFEKNGFRKIGLSIVIETDYATIYREHLFRDTLQ